VYFWQLYFSAQQVKFSHSSGANCGDGILPARPGFAGSCLEAVRQFEKPGRIEGCNHWWHSVLLGKTCNWFNIVNL